MFDKKRGKLVDRITDLLDSEMSTRFEGLDQQLGVLENHGNIAERMHVEIEHMLRNKPEQEINAI